MPFEKVRRAVQRHAAAVAGLLLLLCVCATAVQARETARESAVRAAFLFKFATYVEWPPGTFRQPTDPLVIGVLFDEAVASEREELVQGRSVNGQPVAVRRVRDPEAAGPLHILYAGGTREGRIREAFAAVRGPVLTVAGVPVGGSGTVLHFLVDQGRVRFHASPPAAAARGLRLSARLLAVAHAVEGR
jgi:hypothetical protein